MSLCDNSDLQNPSDKYWGAFLLVTQNSQRKTALDNPRTALPAGIMPEWVHLCDALLSV
ncbi:hypothetical protein NIES4074_33030 [Cylindrospermum sp. NIES-4074]|nr:hypothetical protein NIES4074_33030 [Cylindrospermum sp. NIES-4074]